MVFVRLDLSSTAARSARMPSACAGSAVGAGAASEAIRWNEGGRVRAPYSAFARETLGDVAVAQRILAVIRKKAPRKRFPSHALWRRVRQTGTSRD